MWMTSNALFIYLLHVRKGLQAARGIKQLIDKALITGGTAPLIDANTIEYEIQKWPTYANSTSQYRGPPTFEREIAWKMLEGRE